MRLLLVVLQLLAVGCAHAQPSSVTEPAVPARIDHVPIAVHSLPDARATFEALGFRLKEGRAHENGLRNAFVKLPAGDYLELISPERGATDPVSREYAGFLERGEGGAFLALRVDSIARLATRLQAAGHLSELSPYGAFTTLRLREPRLDWIFLIEYHRPVRDAPELLEHPNSAIGIETVWVPVSPAAALGPLDGLVEVDGLRRFTGPDPGRPPIVGVTLRVRSLEEAREAIRAGTDLDLPVRRDDRGSSVIVPPDLAHGIWIELLER